VGRLLKQGAECVLLPVAYQLQAQFSDAISQINPDVKFVSSYAAMPSDWPTSLKQAGKYTVVGSYPALDSDVPGMVQFRDEMDTYAKKSAQDGYSLRAWVGALVFSEVAKTVDGPLTASSLLKALNKTKSVDTKGLTGPFDFTKPNLSKGVTREFNTYLLSNVAKDGKSAPVGDFTDYAR
jgi:ABC-type branched-subunit amino acid transport system substrate-binding protein